MEESAIQEDFRKPETWRPTTTCIGGAVPRANWLIGMNATRAVFAALWPYAACRARDVPGAFYARAAGEYLGIQAGNLLQGRAGYRLRCCRRGRNALPI